MATSFPTSIDNATNLPDPLSTDTLATVPHSTLHKNVNDAIKAIETKLGTGTTIAAANGGTGQSTYAIGDILYASTTSALSKLADVATGNALISGGVGVIPSWGKIGLTTHISGTLPIANGGTNATSANAAMANLMSFATNATAGTTTILSNASSYYQQFTGTLTQTVQLPLTSTLSQGWTFHVVNNSTSNLSIVSNTSVAIITVPAGTTAMVTCIDTTVNTLAAWEAGLTDFSTYTGTGGVVLSAAPTLSGTVTMSGPQFLTGGITYMYQPAITTNSTTGAQTLTIANLLTEVINYTGAGITTMTLPTGTLMDGGISGIVSNVAFDWSIVNTTANIITMAAGTTHTYVGNLSVAANVSARFRSVRTGVTTWVTYRIS